MMKVLMINKFLYPNGGSETYIFKLGDYLNEQGHEVQYFGMEHAGRCVENAVNAYTSDMDFHGGSKLAKLTYPIKTIYSKEARVKVRKVLDNFEPDVCHINNFNYQLTPSIILEIVKWREQAGRKCRIVYTAHDYQLVCPNHMLRNPNTHQNCEKCLDSHFINCMKGKCIHGSRAKSAIGTMEAFFWDIIGTYKYIDKIICPSEFVKTKMDSNPIFAKKTRVIHNFIDCKITVSDKVGDYVLYYGRLSREKGVETLVQVCQELPHIKFVFVGRGPLDDSTNGIFNIENKGFLTGDSLYKVIQNAKFSICPSEWNEVFGLTIGESMKAGIPVIGSDKGAIPELIENNVNGLIFEAGNKEALKKAIKRLWEDEELLNKMKENCVFHNHFMSVADYAKELMDIYEG